MGTETVPVLIRLGSLFPEDFRNGRSSFGCCFWGNQQDSVFDLPTGFWKFIGFGCGCRPAFFVGIHRILEILVLSVWLRMVRRALTNKTATEGRSAKVRCPSCRPVARSRGHCALPPHARPVQGARQAQAPSSPSICGSGRSSHRPVPHACHQPCPGGLRHLHQEA